MRATRYPKARWVGNGPGSGPYNGDGPFKGLQHTTESMRYFPGYADGKTAPHITYNPLTREFAQHTGFDVAARSLRNEVGGVETNRDSVIQLEIVCFSDRAQATKYAAWDAIWVGDLTDEHLQDIADFWKWVSAEWGVKLRWRGKQALSYAEANTPGFRFTHAEWNEWDGLCAHHDAPEQTHWDTGAFDWAAMFRLLTEGDHMADTYKNLIADHSVTDMPDWTAASNEAYKEAGGTTVPESLAWPAFRFDFAWFWNKFIRPNMLKLAAHAAALDKLETGLDVLVMRVTALEAAATTGPAGDVSDQIRVHAENPDAHHA